MHECTTRSEMERAAARDESVFIRRRFWRPVLRSALGRRPGLLRLGVFGALLFGLGPCDVIEVTRQAVISKTPMPNVGWVYVTGTAPLVRSDRVQAYVDG